MRIRAKSALSSGKDKWQWESVNIKKAVCHPPRDEMTIQQPAI